MLLTCSRAASLDVAQDSAVPHTGCGPQLFTIYLWSRVALPRGATALFAGFFRRQNIFVCKAVKNVNNKLATSEAADDLSGHYEKQTRVTISKSPVSVHFCTQLVSARCQLDLLWLFVSHALLFLRSACGMAHARSLTIQGA